MPLNLSNREQNSGHLFYNRRLKAAITRFSVRMKHDDRKQQAAVVLSIVFVIIGVGWMALLHIMKPTGLVSRSAIIGDRDTGQVYAKIEGRLYPALNLTSARLAVGSAVSPSWVQASEIAKYPTGPMLGIPGAPDYLTATPGAISAWSVCDTAALPGIGAVPVVTSIAGSLSEAGRTAPMSPTQAVLVTHKDATYVIWGGRRSRIDPADRSVTFNLGLDPGITHPREISSALFDAMPTTEPLVVPAISEFGTPSKWLVGSTVGSVLETRGASGDISGFYALLPDGAQPINRFVAELLRTADSQGHATPRQVSPGTLINIPVVHLLNIDYYPTETLDFVDTKTNPVICIRWEKQSSDPQAAIDVFTGRGLPVPASMNNRVVRLVRDDRGPDSVEADQTLILPGASNFVATTSGTAVADSRESLYWISPQGVRYGIQWEDKTLQPMALDPRHAVQAPWAIIRTFASGPAISRDDALLAHDAIASENSVAPIADAPQPAAGR